MILFFTFTASVCFVEIPKRSHMLHQKLEIVSLTTKV